MPDTRSTLLTSVRPTAVPAAAEWGHLAARLQGTVVLPGDPAYGIARQLQSNEFDVVMPAGIAYCATASDVRNCIAFATEHDVGTHIRSGGHSMGGYSTGPGLVVDVSRINHVTYDGATVRLGPGARSIEAINALATQGTQVVTGTFPTVAAGGFVSGGGLGWQTRRFGAASDRLVSARVVLADGRVVRCSAIEEPDLFWALRGGGGGTFGVVVDLEVRPVDAPVMVAYETVWCIEDAVDVLAAWQGWCVDGPDELGSSLVVLPAFGPDGVPIVKIWGGHLGNRAALETALDELAERAGVLPASRSVEEPHSFAKAMHQLLCGTDTVEECQRIGHNPAARGHRHPLTIQSYRLTGRAAGTTEAAALLEAWDPALDQERYLLCIALGGAANRVDRTSTAYVHRGARFLTGFQIALRAPDPSAEDIARMLAWADRADETLAPLSCGSYINFPSTRITPTWGPDHWGENHLRLVDVKRHYDPDSFFRHAGCVGEG